ncbi:MAG TPA: hypothetical protein VHK01_01340 [Lacipirellulaceae bacterium]|jgi:hypothetical protein|nr:hypothetical protein [Lacipirellulaceae bacterium]
MNDKPQPQDDSAEFENFDSAVATIEQDTQSNEANEWTGPCCEKCEAPLKSDVVTICRKCGWYASLGTFVEVDPNWETEDETDTAGASTPQKSHLRVWLELLPKWSWVIIGTVLGVIVESIVVRLVTPAGSSIRTIWSLSQLMFGVLTFISCHIFNFVVLAAEDADFGVMDMLLKPLKLWIRAVRELPKRLWVSNTAASSVTAAAMSILVIGGIPYERFWDWGFDAPVKQELMAAVMDRAKQVAANEADSLEDAIGDFAGTADGLINGTETPEKPKQRADCVILGYQLDKEGRLSALVLGTTHLGTLVHAGSVTPKMSETEKRELLQMLAAIRTHEPLVSIESDRTIWVKPKYTCRVKYLHKEKGHLTDIEWDKMLGTIQVK